MKRIITWGLSYSDYDSQRELFSLIADGDVEVVAEVKFIPSEEEIFGRRSSVEDAFNQPHDMVVYFGVDEADVRAELEKLGIPTEKEVLGDLGSLIGDRNSKILSDQVKVIKDLLEASDSQIADREWLFNKLGEYGFFPFFKLVKKPQTGVRYSTCGILQVPDEFVDFCLYLSNLKCQKAIEVGVYKGSSSYVMAALLYRNNPDLVYEMVDIEDGLVNYDEISKLIPAIRKRIPSTSADFIGQEYDYCFIDADHSYGAVMEDYRNVGQYATKMTVFHDVFGHEYDELDGGTVRGWRELKELNKDKEIIEFSKFPDKWMGLGVIKWT